MPWRSLKITNGALREISSLYLTTVRHPNRVFQSFDAL